MLAVAGNDGTIRVYHSKEKNKSRNIVAHEDAAQSVLFDRSGDYLVTASSGKNIAGGFFPPFEWLQFS